MDYSPCQLPPVTQQWAHSVCSIDLLTKALKDPNVTAIESDIVMGTETTQQPLGATTQLPEPIMAHPPLTSSDLTLQSFLDMTIRGSTTRSLQRHLKLDFKEEEAMIVAVTRMSTWLESQEKVDMNENTIFLNADILVGPGYRYETPNVNANLFITTCLRVIPQHQLQHCAFSLGWRVDCRALSGYTSRDVAKMKKLILKHELMTKSQGVVLAVNARLLTKNSSVFDAFLKEFPSTQLLVCVGCGEPPISSAQISYLQQHFQKTGLTSQIGYDCQVAKSLWQGFFYDLAVLIVGFFWVSKRYMQVVLRTGTLFPKAKRKSHSD